jgi:hypothetical protein
MLTVWFKCVMCQRLTGPLSEQQTHTANTCEQQQQLTLYLILCSACCASHFKFGLALRSAARKACPIMGLAETGWLLLALPLLLLLLLP